MERHNFYHCSRTQWKWSLAVEQAGAYEPEEVGAAGITNPASGVQEHQCWGHNASPMQKLAAACGNQKGIE
eukprot:965394-Amphidinium_carterae.1